MSWRWLVDARGEKVKVDRVRLTVVLAANAIGFAILRAVLPDGLYALSIAAVMVAALALELWLRRRR